MKKDRRWLHGTESHLPENRWDDLRVEPVARGTAGVNTPSFEKFFDDAPGTSNGVYLYNFDDSANDKEVFFSVQMPHAWHGTKVYPHVHWVGAVADTAAEPRWGLEYTWAGIGGEFGDTTIIYTTRHKVGAAGAEEVDVVANRHYISAFPAITPQKNQDGISSVMVCRLFRNSSSALDTYNAASSLGCGLLYIDFHFELDGLGSRGEYTK